MRAGRTGLLLALLVLPGASASLAGLKQQPGIRVAGIDLVELGFLEQRFAVLLRVRNPNGVELPITGLSFDIEVNGRRCVSGLSDEAVTVQWGLPPGVTGKLEWGTGPGFGANAPVSGAGR